MLHYTPTMPTTSPDPSTATGPRYVMEFLDDMVLDFSSGVSCSTHTNSVPSGSSGPFIGLAPTQPYTQGCTAHDRTIRLVWQYAWMDPTHTYLPLMSMDTQWNAIMTRRRRKGRDRSLTDERDERWRAADAAVTAWYDRSSWHRDELAHRWLTERGGSGGGFETFKTKVANALASEDVCTVMWLDDRTLGVRVTKVDTENEGCGHIEVFLNPGGTS